MNLILISIEYPIMKFRNLSKTSTKLVDPEEIIGKGMKILEIFRENRPVFVEEFKIIDI